jgi:lysophospholipase L1-like esterase
MTARLFFISLLAVACGGPIARAAHLRLFVLTGQSNSLGTTNAGEPDLTPGSDPADAHIRFYWHNWADATTSLGDSAGQFVPLQAQQGGYYAGSATHWGPEIQFGRMLFRAGVRDIGIVKCSRGGGGNTYWLKSSPDPHMYHHLVATVTGAVAALTAAGHTCEIAALLYLQGESDSPAEAAAAGTRLRTLVDNLRADLPNASALVGLIGGIAAPGATRDLVRANHLALGNTEGDLDYFSNLDLQAWTAPDGLHFNRAAKLRIGERFAQACFAAGVVARHYGRLACIGDSITHGGNGDHPSYRYPLFRHLARQGVPTNASTGYTFVGSVTGPYLNSGLTTPQVNGQGFENRHDGHFGWRVSWTSGRVALPAGRYLTNNLGAGHLACWTGASNTYATADAGWLPYTGAVYAADTALLMMGINDLADGVAAEQVRDDLGALIDRLRTAQPQVRILVGHVLHTTQGPTRDAQVEALNSLLPALVAAKNAASSNSPVWLADVDADFVPAAMTYDGVHPNTAGEQQVGDRFAAALGLMESPLPSAGHQPPCVESGAGAFAWRFEGSDIWNGTNFVQGWGEVGLLTKSLSSTTDLQVIHPATDGRWIGSTGAATHPNGWDAGNSSNWTFEVRLKFSANPAGFIVWLGTDTARVIVELNGAGTEDFDSNESESNTFQAVHNNLDGAYHTFRIAHDAAHGCYHVWRDAVRLTPLAGVPYDQVGADARLILGDYTSGGFGNNFGAVIDYVCYDATGAYLPTGADADADGLPDSWEFAFFNPGDTYEAMAAAVTAAVAVADSDNDGLSNGAEYLANTVPTDANSFLACAGVETSGTGDLRIGLLSSPQRTYILYRAADLALQPLVWVPVAGPTSGTDGWLPLTDTGVVAAAGVYRIGAAPP